MQPVRGTRDLIGADYDLYSFVTETARHLALLYGFEGISTPIMESKDVFTRPLGEGSDIVTKEMYELAQRGEGKEDKVVLRPEGTAAVARAILSNGLTQSMPQKLFYDGPMFRYERPQKGRLRQLHQFGIEFLGVDSPLADVEVVALAHDILKGLGLSESIQLELNTLGDDESRALYREHLVEYLGRYRSDLSADSQIRLEKNPLRILDSKDVGDQKILENTPLLEGSLNDTSRRFFDRVKEELERLAIPYVVSPRLVRGLDYYCHTAFEFTTTELGAQSTVLAGGRYDGLLEMMGGPSIPGVGWAAGIDRLMMLTQKTAKKASMSVVMPMDDSLEGEALEWTQYLRKNGHRSSLLYGGGNFGKKMKKAAKLGADFALILGAEESKESKITLKNLETGEQVSCDKASVLSYLTSHSE